MIKVKISTTIEQTDKMDENLQMVKGDEGRYLEARDDSRA